MSLRQRILDRLRAPWRRSAELHGQEVAELRRIADRTEESLAVLRRMDRFLADIRRIGEGVQLALTQETLLEVVYRIRRGIWQVL